MSLSELKPMSYLLLDHEIEPVLLKRVRGMNCERWAIRQIGACFNKHGKWEYEPMPSSRTNAFYRRCRWDTAEAAIADWVKHKGKSRIQG